MTQIGVGIVGTGGIADACHGPAVKGLDGTELRAVLSRDLDRGRAFLERHGHPDGRAYVSIDEFAGDAAISLAIVASPDRLHFEHALACLRFGKHVLVEKPMACTRAEAEELARVAQQHGLILATGFHLRFHSGHRLVRDQIREGALGRVRHVRVAWAFTGYDESNWRASANLGKWWSLGAVGAHCIDLARWLTSNDEVEWHNLERVIDRSVWPSAHDQTALVSGQFPDMTTVEVLSSIEFGPFLRCEVFGDGGSAILDGTLGRAGAGTILLNGVELSFPEEDPFVNHLRHLRDAIRTGGAAETGAQAGVRSVLDLLAVIDPDA